MIPNTRSKYVPSPIFGNISGWSIGDLPASYTDPIKLIPSTSVPASCASWSHGGNSIEILVLFSDSYTSCDITVQVSDGTIVKTFTGVSLFNNSNLFAGGYKDSFLLAGDPVTLNVLNITGPGTVTVGARKVS